MTIRTPPVHVAESTHWYKFDGSPVYEICGTSGAMRPCTLRDARKLYLVPSVTTIIRCAAAPGLENWKQQQVLFAAMTLPRLSGETEKSWFDRVILDSREQARKAAEKGTAIHASLQGYYEGVPPAEYHAPHVRAAACAVEEQFGKQEWICEKCFAHPLGFGGKVDMHCRIAVIDAKSKEFYDDAKRLAWDEHCMQLAAYRVGLSLDNARCGNVFVSTVVPGLAVVHEWTEDEIQNGWEMFSGLLQYWRAKNNYRPVFQEYREILNQIASRPGTEESGPEQADVVKAP